MKIVYGVHGDARGHVSRARALLPELLKNHDVKIFAGGDAYELLSKEYEVSKVPYIGYAYRHGKSKVSNYLTLKRNTPYVFQLVAGMAGYSSGDLKKVEKDISDFSPDFVLTDFEAWTRIAGAKLDLPIINLDHGSTLALCKADVPKEYKTANDITAFFYRLAVRQPKQFIASSFFNAKPVYDNVKAVGPVIKPEVKKINPSDGENILVYINRQNAFTGRLEDCLRKIDAPVIIYGAKGQTKGNLKFKEIDAFEFVQDLAECRALISRGGNQIFGEALWFGKPVISFPETVSEQQINAHIAQKMGFAIKKDLYKVSIRDFEDFFKNEDELRKSASKYGMKDASNEVIDLIVEFGNSFIKS